MENIKISPNKKETNNLKFSKVFFLTHEQEKYEITITKDQSNIILLNRNYILKLSNEELINKFKYVFDSINESFNFILRSFSEKKVFITNIYINKKITLKLFYKFEDKEKFITLYLLYSKKKYTPDNIFSNSLVPINITKNAYCKWDLDNTYCIFNSINSNLLILVYATKEKSIVFFDLNTNQMISEIKNAHNTFITNFRHTILNKQNNIKEDIIMSISAEENNIKVWNVNNYSCILNLMNINKIGYIDSACFINDNNNIYIITSNSKYHFEPLIEPIKIFNFSGEQIGELKNSKKDSCFLDSYYRNKKKYIIVGCSNYVKSYDFDTKKKYKIYCDKKCKSFFHYSSIITENEGITKLIESCLDPYIRIWDFDTAILLNKIKVEKYLYGICLYMEKYLFVGCQDHVIKVLDLKDEIVINELKGHKYTIGTIKYIYNEKYGDCLISQGLLDDQIKIWKNIKQCIIN